MLDEPPGYEVFSDPGKLHFEKVNKNVLNTITYYLEDDDHKDVKFNGETRLSLYD